jgi:DNA-binding CsgD family transcriptional regulator
VARPNKHEALGILERRREVAVMFRQGYAQWEIAAAMGLHPRAVSRDLEAVQEQLRADTKGQLADKIAGELARLAEIERQAWEGWNKSRENAETRRARSRGRVAETERVVRGQSGDPRFLGTVLASIARRCGLLGLDADCQAGPCIVAVEDEQPLTVAWKDRG